MELHVPNKRSQAFAIPRREHLKLSNSTILVTGAAGGIGSKVCSLLDMGGATLVLNGMHASKLNLLKSTLRGHHHVVAADLGKAEGRQMIVDVCRDVGGLDALVNLAGIVDFAMYDAQSTARIERLFQVNALGPMLLTRELLPMLLARPQARILHVGSGYGAIGHPGFVAYGASKAALRMFSEAMARELVGTKVTTAFIVPGTTATSFNTGRVMEMNDALGNGCDTPLFVATQVVDMIVGQDYERFLGRAGRALMWLNALMPSTVTAVLEKRFSLVRQYAQR